MSCSQSAILVIALACATTVNASAADEPEATLICQNWFGRSPANTSAPEHLRYEFRCTLLNSSGAPIPNYPADWVSLEVHAPCQNPVVLHPTADSNSSGEVKWDSITLERAGGACFFAGAVVIEAVTGVNAVTLDNARSPDIDGDGLIALNDLHAWRQSFVSQAPVYIGDLNFSGTITLFDLTVWQAHFASP